MPWFHWQTGVQRGGQVIAEARNILFSFSSNTICLLATSVGLSVSWTHSCCHPLPRSRTDNFDAARWFCFCFFVRHLSYLLRQNEMFHLQIMSWWEVLLFGFAMSHKNVLSKRWRTLTKMPQSFLQWMIVMGWLVTDDLAAISCLYCHIDGNTNHRCSAQRQLLVRALECASVCQSTGSTYYHRQEMHSRNSNPITEFLLKVQMCFAV